MKELILPVIPNEGDGLLGEIGTLRSAYFRKLPLRLKQQLQQPGVSAHGDGKMTDVLKSLYPIATPKDAP